MACPVVYGAAFDGIEIPVASLGLPMREPDARLLGLVESLAKGRLAEVGDEASVVAQVRQEVARRLTHGAPTLDEVARRLGSSARSLQRRLADEGDRILEKIHREGEASLTAAERRTLQDWSRHQQERSKRS